MTILLFCFLPLIIVSFYLFLWHVPLLFFLIALSYIYVHDVSFTFPSPFWNSFIWLLCMPCCLFFFLSCSFLLIHFCAWQSSNFSFFLLELFHFTTMHVMSLYFSCLIALSLYLISVHDISHIFISLFLVSFVSFMCMAFLFFSFFLLQYFHFKSVHDTSFHTARTPHPSIDSIYFPSHLFILCAGYFSYWPFTILLFSHLILIHDISLAFPF